MAPVGDAPAESCATFARAADPNISMPTIMLWREALCLVPAAQCDSKGAARFVRLLTDIVLVPAMLRTGSGGARFAASCPQLRLTGRRSAVAAPARLTKPVPKGRAH